MQLYQQWLQVAAATLHIEERKNKEEDEKSREGEWRQDEEPDDRERSGSDSGFSEDQCMARSVLQFGRRREYGRRGQSTDAGGGTTDRASAAIRSIRA